MKPIETFGYKKTIPEEIYFPALKTLSFYPELKNVRIIFRFNCFHFADLNLDDCSSSLLRAA